MVGTIQLMDLSGFTRVGGPGVADPRWQGLMDGARHVIELILNSRFFI